MTHRVGNILIIAAEPAQQCDMCGKIAELRPYGKNGACICFSCAMLDEEETKRNFARATG
jgi:transcription initiation factor TFIIIB Brf1 subunit/transcription initiation factor TFIIB